MNPKLWALPKATRRKYPPVQRERIVRDIRLRTPKFKPTRPFCAARLLRNDIAIILAVRLGKHVADNVCAHIKFHPCDNCHELATEDGAREPFVCTKCKAKGIAEFNRQGYLDRYAVWLNLWLFLYPVACMLLYLIIPENIAMQLQRENCVLVVLMHLCLAYWRDGVGRHGTKLLLIGAAVFAIPVWLLYMLYMLISGPPTTEAEAPIEPAIAASVASALEPVAASVEWPRLVQMLAATLHQLIVSTVSASAAGLCGGVLALVCVFVTPRQPMRHGTDLGPLGYSVLFPVLSFCVCAMGGLIWTLA
jgi:hypothetical protein